MSSKDPKDMTAGELLRWAANDEPNEYGNTTVSHKLFSALSGKPYGDTNYDEDARNIRALADKIDAEIEEVRIRYFLENLDTRIEKYGYPSRIERELFDEWINRCFIQRPLDEAGEPVQFGDNDIEWDETDECRAPGAVSYTHLTLPTTP